MSWLRLSPRGFVRWIFIDSRTSVHMCHLLSFACDVFFCLICRNYLCTLGVVCGARFVYETSWAQQFSLSRKGSKQADLLFPGLMIHYFESCQSLCYLSCSRQQLQWHYVAEVSCLISEKLCNSMMWCNPHLPSSSLAWGFWQAVQLPQAVKYFVLRVYVLWSHAWCSWHLLY